MYMYYIIFLYQYNTPIQIIVKAKVMLRFVKENRRGVISSIIHITRRINTLLKNSNRHI